MNSSIHPSTHTHIPVARLTQKCASVDKQRPLRAGLEVAGVAPLTWAITHMDGGRKENVWLTRHGARLCVSLLIWIARLPGIHCLITEQGFYRAGRGGGRIWRKGNATASSDLHLAAQSMQKVFLRNEKFISNILRHFHKLTICLHRLSIGLWMLTQTDG